MRKDVIVIGGGPAGFTAAIFAAMRGLSVTILDKNRRKTLAKLRITGKGRCNLTNDCPPAEIFDSIPRGSRFLRSSISSFGPADIMAFFEGLGVPLKTERGRRVFPVSDRAEDVAAALERKAAELGIEVARARAVSVETEDGRVCGVRLQDGRVLPCRSAVLATGGLSYPLTGSDGDGYRMAEALGHTCTPLFPSLVSLTCAEEFLPRLEGLSLKNVALVCREGKKTLYREQGEMMFTSRGITGPLVLTLSSFTAGKDLSCLKTWIDLKPALDEATLDKRILRDFAEGPNRAFRNSLDALLPRSLIPVIVELSGIDPDRKVNGVTAKERARLVRLLKEFPLTLTGRGGYEEAVVTAGGIVTSEVDPRTMESKKIKGLHIAGELLDCDGCTGGYNLTIAFATGHAAGVNILKEKEGKMRAIAIDGPSGAGKSTIAREAAKELGFIYVDTGAMYRAIGLYMLRQGVPTRDWEAVIARLPEVSVDIRHIDGQQHIFLNDEDVNGLIRTEAVSMAASDVSAIPQVRAFLMDLQRGLAKRNVVVMDGRDIGTVILPDAACKIFLTASPEERAKRRWLQLKEKGQEADYEKVLQDLKERDYNDSHREAAPLKPAEDSVILDTTECTLEQSIRKVIDTAKEKLGL